MSSSREPAAQPARGLAGARMRAASVHGIAGALYATAAYGSWGLLPLYWKALAHVPALEILAHRVLWSVLFTALLLTLLRGWRELGRALADRQMVLVLSATALLIASNWLLFI
jgi:chloramphenicol-sensitive protein RarD